MKIILVSAYAVNPYKGSEDGTGWNYILQIARFQKVIAITRENNQIHIEKFIVENPNLLYQNIKFYYFDLPSWMRKWKKGNLLSMLYYQIWQRGIIYFIEKNKLSFDIVHNLNFHNDWTPSFLWKLNKPFVWGPIGHHPLIPKVYLKNYGFQVYLKDRFLGWIKFMFWNYSLSLKKTISKADKIILMNSSVLDVLNIPITKQFKMHSIASESPKEFVKENTEEFRLISVGRFVPLKGFDLSIDSFAKFHHLLTNDIEKKNCKLTLVGKGPQENLLKQLVIQNGIQDYVEFIPWLDRKSLFELYKMSSAFLFPSHEGAGMVVAEALSFGLPVICLDNIGPGDYIHSQTGLKSTYDTYENTVISLSKNIHTLYQDKKLRAEMSLNARLDFESNFHWDRRGESLQKLYSSI